MSLSKTIPALEGFVRLNPAVWFYQPSDDVTTVIRTSKPTGKEPDLILICGWMGATPRHISKYTAGYQVLYPSSRILFITTSISDAILRSEAANLNRVKPVLEILYSLPVDAKLLVQFSSNGGAWTASAIAREYKEKMGRKLPISALIADSSPGKAGFSITVRAFAVSLPRNPILYFLGLNILRFLFGLYVLGYIVQRKLDLVESARRSLNDEKLFGKEGRRLYVYSTGDDMVRWQDVEEHAEEAREKGYAVDLEKFGKSGHAAHLILDPERYWRAVERVWGMVR